MKHKGLTLAIDFDGVIHDYKHPLPGRKMGAPLPGAVAALEDLYDRRHRLIIHTTKATTESGRQAVEEWLDFYGFEYHDVTATKPNADHYIDDRAIKHTSWADTLDQLGVTDE